MKSRRLKAVFLYLLGILFLGTILHVQLKLQSDVQIAAFITSLLAVCMYASVVRGATLWDSYKTKADLTEGFHTLMYGIHSSDQVFKNWMKVRISRRVFLMQMADMFLAQQGVPNLNRSMSNYLVDAFEMKIDEWLLNKRIVDSVEAE